MKLFVRYLLRCIPFMVSFVLVGCGTTAVMHTHPLLDISSSSDSINVYFLRPDFGFDGVSDFSFTISINDQKLLTIAKGEYTLVSMKTYSGDITVQFHDVVNRAGMNSWTKSKETRPFDFLSGNTYYITFRREYTGYFTYIPYSISEKEAKNLAHDLKPVGDAKILPLQ